MKKTFWEIIDICEKKDSPSDVLHSLQTREMLYETDKNGKTIKKYLYRLSGGRTVTETCTRLPYRDISKLSPPALQAYPAPDCIPGRNPPASRPFLP